MDKSPSIQSILRRLRFYIEQANGIDMFKDMLESMPDLSMKVEAPEPKDIQTVYVTNQTDTKGFGSFLQFNNSHSKRRNGSME